MSRLTFGLNVTLDGCCDYRVGIADDELHDYWTQLMDAAGAMLWGRVTYVRADRERLAGGGARRERPARAAGVGAQAGGQAEVCGVVLAARLPVEQHLPRRGGLG